MTLYISIFVVTILGYLSSRRYQTLILLMLSIVLMIFIGFRHQVGGDWYNYLDIYESIQRMNSVWIAMYVIEPGYGLLNYYFSGSSGIYYINFICACVLCIGFYKFCKQQPYPLLSASIMLPYTIFIMGMGYTRQATAFGFILLAYVAFIDKKYFYTLLLIMLGFLFHRTAIIILLLFGVKFVKTDKIGRTLWILFISVILLFFLIKRIDLGIYGDDTKVSSEGGIFRGLMNLIPALIFLRYYKYFLLKYNKYYLILYFLALSSIVFFIVGLQLSTLSDRFSQYFSVIQAMIFPMFINKFIYRDRKLIISLIILFYSFFLLYFFINSSWVQSSWIPYKNYLFL